MILLYLYDSSGLLMKVDVGKLANARLKTNSVSNNYELMIILTAAKYSGDCYLN